MPLPDPRALHPIRLPDGTPHLPTVHLSVAIAHPNIHAGDYSYFSEENAPDSPGGWAARLAPYLYEGAPDHLHIGRFCQIAQGTRIVTASANHATRGISTFPFAVFDPEAMRGFTPDTRDSVIGNDVWLGMNTIVAPAARIGDGAIVAAGSVVRGEVPPYAVVAGNPARVIRMRFSPGKIECLTALKWWDWDEERLARAVSALQAANIAALEALAP